MFRFFGIALVVLALAIGIVPQFTDCTDQVTLANGKTQPMKCHWSAQSEMVVALPIGIAGLLMILTRKKETVRSLFILGAVMGAAAMLIPAKIIGVCATPTHICVTTMKPAVLILGGLVISTSLIGLALTMRKQPVEE
jgi:hypothetical protein